MAKSSGILGNLLLWRLLDLNPKGELVEVLDILLHGASPLMQMNVLAVDSLRMIRRNKLGDHQLLHLFSKMECNNFTYDREFYVVDPYLVYKEFVFYSDHEAFCFLNGQKKVSTHHAKWIASLQKYSFSIKHQTKTLNKVADVLSCESCFTITTQVVRIEVCKDLYLTD